MDRLLDVIAVFSIVIMILVLISVRRAHIRVEYSVSWLSAAVVLFIVSRNGMFLQHASEMMGITYAPVALLFFVFCVFLVVFYRLSIRISEMKDANIALAQRLAILEYQLRARHEEQSNQSNPS
jgi:hypothetical protein